MEREVNAILSPLGVDAALSRRVAGALLSVEATLPPPAAPPSILRQCLNVVARRPRFSSADSASDPERRRLLPTSSAASSKGDDEDEDDKGLTAFLLKFGEGLEETTDARLFISAFTIGISYLLGGLVPLLVRPPPLEFVADEHSRRSPAALLLHRHGLRRPHGLDRHHERRPPHLRHLQDLLHRRGHRHLGSVPLSPPRRCFSARRGSLSLSRTGYTYGAISTLLVGAFAAGASFLIVSALEGAGSK